MFNTRVKIRHFMAEHVPSWEDLFCCRPAALSSSTGRKRERKKSPRYLTSLCLHLTWVSFSVGGQNITYLCVWWRAHTSLLQPCGHRHFQNIGLARFFWHSGDQRFLISINDHKVLFSNPFRQLWCWWVIYYDKALWQTQSSVYRK